MTLAEEFGIGPEERNARRTFIGLTKVDIELLARLRPAVEREVDGIVDRFYDRLLSFPEARMYFQDTASLNRAKTAQGAYLVDLFKGDFGEAYFERRLQIGVVHDRIGLPPKWYIGGNAIFYELLVPLIRRRFLFQPTRMSQCLVALNKVLNLDQQLVMDTYIGTMLRRLLDLGTQLKEAIDVLAPSARQSADEAEATLALARSGLTSANAGNETARAMLAGLAIQKDKSQETACKILQLGEQLARIETVARQVTEISLETDLLALNASVQSARAGDQRGGFDVVAREIRKLSDQTRTLIDEIRALLAEIKGESEGAIAISRESTAAVDEGTILAEDTGRAFSDLARLVGDAHESVRLISEAAQRQAHAISRLQEMAADIR